MNECISIVIATFHMTVIAVDFRGAIAVLTNRFHLTRLSWWQYLYVAIAFGKSLSVICLSECPLTTAENFFRRRGAFDTAYFDSFVSHYLPGLPSEIDVLITCLLMLASLVAVLRVAHHQIAEGFVDLNMHRDN